ncbi:hypothetical protein TrST_g7667 [Triparma strigata]|uniref:Glycosyl transferase family 1 domain-containing protein n=1 Tax=Triparma strigata TaxID=1606541 RepID=A0A9W6ZWY3_9STRA|nr:hypothetical protein TrST_g7667 [Triparma strigata]
MAQGSDEKVFVKVVFDKSFEIEERFNDVGLARTWAAGVKVGSHLVQAGADWALFDVVGGGGGEAGEGGADGEVVELDLEGGGESSCTEKPRIMFVDSFPTKGGVDGQRRIWLEQIENLGEVFEFQYTLIGDLGESPFYKILTESNYEVDVKRLIGQYLKSDRDADKIAEIFQGVGSFDDLEGGLRSIFSETCGAFSAVDIVVFFNHAPNTVKIDDTEMTVIDHYLVDLAKICGASKVVMELPLAPDEVVGGLKGVDMFVAPSFYVRNDKVFEKSEVPFAVIRPGGSGGGVERKMRTEGGGEGEIVRVAMVGRLDPDKSPLMLLRAAALLKDWCLSGRVLFDIVGTGILEAELKVVSSGLGIDACINFMGSMEMERVEDILSEADIFVNPSVFPQTWGIANLEAMAAGAAVVAFSVGGCAEYLIDGVNCKVPREHGAEALAEAIAALVNDQHERRRIGERGRNFVVERGLTMANMVAQYKVLYDMMMKDTR